MLALTATLPRVVWCQPGVCTGSETRTGGLRESDPRFCGLHPPQSDEARSPPSIPGLYSAGREGGGERGWRRPVRRQGLLGLLQGQVRAFCGADLRERGGGGLPGFLPGPWVWWRRSLT